MKRFCAVFLSLAVVSLLCGTAVAAAADPCASCHKDYAQVLPKGHAAVEGGFEKCIACHAIGQSGDAQPNPFSTAIHQRHAVSQKMECTVCHTVQSGTSFGLKGTDANWGPISAEDLALMKEKMTSWGTSKYTDNLHAKAKVDCAGCHGKQAPTSDATVENARCLSCHGPMEKLAEKSANAQFPKRNPHASHYGNDIACNTCHKGHDTAEVMCYQCHKQWKVGAIPGGE